MTPNPSPTPTVDPTRVAAREKIEALTELVDNAYNKGASEDAIEEFLDNLTPEDYVEIDEIMQLAGYSEKWESFKEKYGH